jgi:TonB family protein
MQGRLALALAMVTLALTLDSRRAHAQTPPEEEPMNACVSALASLLRSRLRADDYPEAARKADVQGTVWFLLTCNSQGTFEGSWVERGSGSDLLDESAMRTVERAFPVGVPAPPQCRFGHGFSVSLPLVYRLQTLPSKR